jgi:hypothetical protein
MTLSEEAQTMSIRKNSLGQTLLLVLALLLPSSLFSQAYPIKVEKAIAFTSLTVSLNRISLQMGKGKLAFIECEKGVTGVVLIASGSFSFATKDTQSIHDTFTNALLRFNPSDYAEFIAPVGVQESSQAELLEQTTNVLERSFKRLYHKGSNASIPNVGVLAGVLFTDNLGDIIINEGGERPIIYSLNDRRALYDGGASAPIPSFQNISKNWLPRVNRQRMDGIWQKEGITASGDNYFYLPAAASGKSYSQRFDPLSTYFQSWFGMYVVKDNETGRYGLTGSQPDPRAILRLAMTDQRAWLKNFAGLEAVVVASDEQTPITCVQASAAGLDGWKISARLLSNSDVGDKNPQSGRPAFLLVPPAVWMGYIDNYARVALDVVMYVIYSADTKETYVIYYNGVDFTDKKGTKHRTMPDIQVEMEAMIASLKVPKK